MQYITHTRTSELCKGQLISKLVFYPSSEDKIGAKSFFITCNMCIALLKYFRLRSLWPTTRDYYFMNIHKGQFYQSIFFICHRNKKLNAKSSVILNVFCDEKSLRLVFKRMEFNHWDGENKAHCFIPKTCFVPIFHIFFLLSWFYFTF